MKSEKDILAIYEKGILERFLGNFLRLSYDEQWDNSGLQSPALPDELIIKQATLLSISVTIKATFIPNLCVGESGYLGFTFT